MHLPTPRGPVSARLVEDLRRAPHALAAVAPDFTGPPLTDEDLHLTLHVCYELHYRGWDGVAADWEWEPSLLRLRAVAERRFEGALRAAVAVPRGPAATAPAMAAALAALVRADDAPPLSRYLERRATAAEFREFVTHRSVYHQREADPHTWAIPRLGGAAKAALVEIQRDEYGDGRLDRMHSTLFDRVLAFFDLDTRYGAHVDAVPAVTLANNNLMSLFGLHRRLRGALLGHLAAYEMTSSVPNRRYGGGLRRLGGGPADTVFYDEHVEADAVHEQIAAHDMCGGFAETHPAEVAEVLFGAACALRLDGLAAAHLLDRWKAGASSLYRPAALPAAA
ncbi:hypothetical protein GCM10010124_16510 [Pilimelia terevasa]|uniref:Iron-containing redox enzyme n=1 Tax=Pilimelia terevasa TaxID=53372 RepID=A0A8J3FGE2_9ACTN|nr:iron-containing redox enzyme family protein [Pilimelia terevasa]GGK24675.1 hypothetical protein GCM10010124_16510 [Pilimelia terevasa]